MICTCCLAVGFCLNEVTLKVTTFRSDSCREFFKGILLPWGKKKLFLISDNFLILKAAQAVFYRQ